MPIYVKIVDTLPDQDEAMGDDAAECLEIMAFFTPEIIGAIKRIADSCEAIATALENR